MIAEALQKIVDLSRAADTPHPVQADDPRVARYFVGGRLVEVAMSPPPRDHGVDALEDIIALAARFAETDLGPVVWIDELAVRLVIDDAGHRAETAIMGLVPSDVFALLRKLRGNPGAAWLDHKPFVRLLKVELAGTGDDVARLLEQVRKVQFENGVITSSKLARGDESMGRTITSKLDAAAVLPDEVVVECPLCKTAGERERYGVRCSLDVDSGLGKFQLLPIPDEVERVVQLHLASIRERLLAGLSTVDVPVYYGRP